MTNKKLMFMKKKKKKTRTNEASLDNQQDWIIYSVGPDRGSDVNIK